MLGLKLIHVSKSGYRREQKTDEEHANLFNEQVDYFCNDLQ